MYSNTVKNAIRRLICTTLAYVIVSLVDSVKALRNFFLLLCASVWGQSNNPDV